MRILLTYNPEAGDDGVEPEELAGALEAAGHTVVAQSLKADGWEAALAAGAELVIVAGGDGAVAQVFKRLAGSETPAALVPSGSANNIAKSLGYGGDDSPEQLMQRLEDRTFGRVNLGSFSSPAGSHVFVESAGGGLFADVLVRAEGLEVEAGGDAKVELGLRLLRDAGEQASAQAWRVEADGVDLSGDFLGVEVLNMRSVGPNVPLAPAAEAGDDELELALIRVSDRAALAAYVKARLQGRPDPPLELDVRRARRIVLQSRPDTPFHVDDDLVDEISDGCTVSVGSGLMVVKPGP